MTDRESRDRRLRLIAMITIAAMLVGAGGGVLISWLF